jgi:hypothetical protein
MKAWIGQQAIIVQSLWFSAKSFNDEFWELVKIIVKTDKMQMQKNAYSETYTTQKEIWYMVFWSISVE